MSMAPRSAGGADDSAAQAATLARPSLPARASPTRSISATEAAGSGPHAVSP